MKKSSLRDFASARARRQFLEKKLNTSFNTLANFSFTEESVEGRSIENLIGATQIPLGVAGPLLLQKAEKTTKRQVYIPLATTEGALVASISRGCKAVSESGGAYTDVEVIGTTRGPVFKTRGLEHGRKIKDWIDSHKTVLTLATQKTSSHLKLLKIECLTVGKNLLARFYFDCGEAMGMNMVTTATREAAKVIEQKTGAQCISLAGNFDIDKKPAYLNFILGRGKKVWAETTLKKRIIKDVLKTTAEKMTEVVYRKNQIGSAMSGSMGFNAHFANPLAAIFAATGQDLAHVVEGSLGITTAEVLKNGDLYFSVYLPALMCGTVGGGTHLPAQAEALKIMNVSNVLEYCRIAGAAVLASEISLTASLAEGSLVKAHKNLARKGAKLQI